MLRRVWFFLETNVDFLLGAAYLVLSVVVWLALSAAKVISRRKLDVVCFLLWGTVVYLYGVAPLLADPVAIVASASSTQVFLGTIINWALSLLLGVLTSFLIYGAKRALALIHVTLTQKDWDVIHSAAEVGGGRLLAKYGANLSKISVDAHSPEVAEFAQKALATIPVEAKKQGVTADTMAELIAGKIGFSLNAAPATGVVADLLAQPTIVSGRVLGSTTAGGPR